MLLAYFIVCPWERIHRKVAALYLSFSHSFALYSIAVTVFFLARVFSSALPDRLPPILNYRGIRLSATFKN